ncbi:dual specificity protein phosphatase family protein [Shewanella olleyana]|uniref:diacylglycerol kinase family protein n=1 Tax=Shewanella olleyana TaxID=135626 RepID=UPI00200E133B|nr:diacylglycerol kinase family protein [Shewanella olleyana]MCL1067520.1 dual specificity protein phosphatase family protein [Shewanella olleyana]
MFIVKYYILIAMACFIASIVVSNFYISVFFAWCFLSFFIVSGAYIFDMPSIFRKNRDGKIVWWIRWAFIPFLLGARAYNAWAIKRDKVEPIQKVGHHLFVSRRLFPADLSYLESKDINCIVDVTAEFSGLESAMLDESFHYLNTPVLDHKAPKLHKIKHAINWIDTQINQSRSVVVHCALGRGRSVFVVAAYLLAKDSSLSVEQVLKNINDVRSTARLNTQQLKTLYAISENGLLTVEDKCCLIVNPVAGGGKWKLNQQQVIRELTRKYSLVILTTSKEVSAQALAKQACAQNYAQVIVSGGDGTVSEVANEIMETNTVLGVMPLGTANALCHVLYGVETKVSPVEKACEAILSGNTKKIDLAFCNGQPMLLILGIGFEEQMIDYAQREQKNDRGQVAYLAGFFNAVVAGKHQQFKVTIDGKKPREMTLESLVVANASPFSTLLAQGGAMPQPDDGQLHVTYLENTESLAKRFLAVSDVMLSGLGVKEQSSHFNYESAQNVEIESNSPIEYVIDGENYSTDSLDISIKKKALTVCVP